MDENKHAINKDLKHPKNDIIPGQNKPGTKEGEPKMATQIAATPLLRGEDAKNLIEQITKPLTLEQKAKLEERRKRFAKTKKRGFL